MVLPPPRYELASILTLQSDGTSVPCVPRTLKNIPLPFNLLPTFPGFGGSVNGILECVSDRHQGSSLGSWEKIAACLPGISPFLASSIHCVIRI
jgi:hypothetical protein